MAVLKTYQHYKYLSALEAHINEAGVSITVSTDFEEYRDCRLQQKGRDAIPPMFDPTCSFINDGKAFWIKCTNTTGQIVHSQAIYLIDNDFTNLANHLMRSKLLYAPPELKRTSSKALAVSLPPATKDILGKITYHGEFWTDTSIRNYKKGELSMLFSRFGIVAASLFWSIDYSFAFTSHLNAFRGFPARIGFTNLDHIIWRNQETHQEHNEWFMWMHTDDVQRMMQLHPEKLSIRKAS